jgi:uncharacterized membrane protein required for colicin V production
MFSIVDVALLLIICSFVCFGLFFGFVHTLGSLVGTILGIFLSTRLVGPAYDAFGFLFGGGAVGKIFMFVIIFLLVSRIVGILFWLIEKFFGIFGLIPFASVINRALGAAFGLIEGIIFVGVVIFFVMQYVPDNVVQATLAESIVAKYLLALVAALQILFPAAAQTVTEQAPQN